MPSHPVFCPAFGLKPLKHSISPTAIGHLVNITSNCHVPHFLYLPFLLGSCPFPRSYCIIVCSGCQHFLKVFSNFFHLRIFSLGEDPNGFSIPRGSGDDFLNFHRAINPSRGICLEHCILLIVGGVNRLGGGSDFVHSSYFLSFGVYPISVTIYYHIPEKMSSVF